MKIILEVTVGDSPGGLYNSAFVGRVYSVTGMKALEGRGVKLNYDFSELRAEFPEGKVLREFVYTGYLKDADVIINFCKLKNEFHCKPSDLYRCQML